MTRSRSALLLTILLFTQPLQYASAGQQDAADNIYRVQPGDILDISVWKEEDLVRQVLVRPDGGISFPLAGDLQAAGKSIVEIQSLIADRLEKYIPEPLVTAAVAKLDGNKIYVLGKVNRPGEFIANRYLDVIQALSIAGGMTPYASENKISILRRTDGQLKSIPFRYSDIEKGKHLQQDIILQSGDVVLVP